MIRFLERFQILVAFLILTVAVAVSMHLHAEQTRESRCYTAELGRVLLEELHAHRTGSSDFHEQLAEHLGQLATRAGINVDDIPPLEELGGPARVEAPIPATGCP